MASSIILESVFSEVSLYEVFHAHDYAESDTETHRETAHEVKGEDFQKQRSRGTNENDNT